MADQLPDWFKPVEEKEELPEWMVPVDEAPSETAPMSRGRPATINVVSADPATIPNPSEWGISIGPDGKPDAGFITGLGRGFLNRASTGRSDEWMAKTDAALEPVGLSSTPPGLSESQRRGLYRNVDALTKEGAPWGYGAGQAAGAIAQVASLPKRAVTGALGAIGSGLGLGLLQGTGDSTADWDLEQDKQRRRALLADYLRSGGRQATLEGGAGALGYGVGEGVKRVSPLVASWLEKLAAERAMKAAGYTKSTLKPLVKEGGADLVRERGQDLLDEGLVKFGQRSEDIAEGVQSRMAQVGARKGAALEALDATGAQFDMGRFIKRADQELLSPMLYDPIRKAEADQLRNLLNAYEQSTQGGIGFVGADKLKQSIQGSINWNTASDNFKNAIQRLSGILKEEIDNQLGEVSGSAAKSKFMEAKRLYGSLADASEAGKDAIAAQTGNRMASLTDYAVGSGTGGAGLAVGLMSGDPVKALMGAGAGVLAAGVNKAFRERGSSSFAVGFQAAGKALRALAERAPERAAGYARALAAAEKRGPQAVAVAHYLIAQRDPEYREASQEMAEAP